MSELRFDGRVAIVTGAGNGLGRSHALLLASRGCKVVVNDLGGGHTGGGKSSEAADRVVAEIKAAGGDAVANYDSVEDGTSIVKSAVDAFGRVDIVINNAGILRDTSFQKMSEQDWELIYRVHVLGAYRVTHAAWNLMREQGYGRIIMTASAAGIYGNFGQANYSMAKLGVVGFANTLAIEGAKKNVRVNTIAPIAGSRMTETVLPKNLLDALKPEYVSPLVAYLCHECCEETGGLFEVGGGVMNKLRWERTVGKSFPLGRPITIEHVQAAFKQITDFTKTTHPSTIQDSLESVMDNVNKPSKGGNEFIDVDAALGFEFPPSHSEYTQRDVSLYALGVGAGRDPMDSKELPLVYEGASDGFRPLPTMTAAIAVGEIMKAAMNGLQAPGMNYGLDRILHGEQYTKVLRPLPPNAKLEHRARIKDIWDKGKGAVVVTEVKTFDSKGSLLAINEVSTFVRGAGGWGGERGPNTDVAIPERAADVVIEEKTAPNQALLYRLSGDVNPLHADPDFAQNFGFKQPILHGLCTFGFAARHVVKAVANNDPRLLSSIRVRFADPVMPGETLVTEVWKNADGSAIFRVKVKERDKVVLTNAVAEFHKEVPKDEQPSAAKSEASSAAAPAAPSGPMRPTEAIFAGINDYLAENPETAKKIGKVFLFKLSGPDSVWTMDLKNSGQCSVGAKGAADCTLELSDDDWVAMASGKADPMQLYTSKKLKISGDLMASQKLNFLKKIDPSKVQKYLIGAGASAPAASASAPSTKGSSWPTSAAADVFIGIHDYIAQHPELVTKVGKKFLFKLSNPDESFVIDLKSAPGGASVGVASDADCTLTMSNEDWLAMASGKADPMQLFTSQKLKISGDLMASQKLNFLKKIDPEAAKAAIARVRGGGAATSAAPKGPSVSSKVFDALSAKLSSDPSLGAKLGGPVLFKVTDGEKLAFVIDDKGAHKGEASAPTTISLSEDALAELAKTGDAKRLYQHGQLRVDGVFAPAHNLSLFSGLLA